MRISDWSADVCSSDLRTMTRGEEGRSQANNSLKALTDRLGMLTDQMRAEQQLMVKLAENQTEIRPMLARLADLAAHGGFGIDEVSRPHIRTMDLQVNRLIEELSLGRP